MMDWISGDCSDQRDNGCNELKRSHEADVGEEKRENKLYVGNLDHRVTEYHVLRLFSPFGKIRFEEYMWHTHGPRRGEPRGLAFVEFCSREDAENAKARMNGRLAFGRPLVVRFADEKGMVTHGTRNVKPPARPLTTSAVKRPVSSGISSNSARIIAIQNKLKKMDKEGRLVNT